MVKFLRRDAARYSKFGKGRGKKAKWRKPTGRDNKMREKIKGHPAVVSIGYKNKSSEEKEKICNTSQLENAKKGSVFILGKVGKKKKIEIAKKAKEKGVSFDNLNVDSFLKKLNKKEIKK